MWDSDRYSRKNKQKTWVVQYLKQSSVSNCSHEWGIHQPSQHQAVWEEITAWIHYKIQKGYHDLLMGFVGTHLVDEFKTHLKEYKQHFYWRYSKASNQDKMFDAWMGYQFVCRQEQIWLCVDQPPKTVLNGDQQVATNNSILSWWHAVLSPHWSQVLWE